MWAIQSYKIYVEPWIGFLVINAKLNILSALYYNKFPEKIYEFNSKIKIDEASKIVDNVVTL